MNAVSISHAEHRVFRQFDRHAGAAVPGFHINFLGQRTNSAFGAPSVVFGSWLNGQGASARSIDYPPSGEESFEWIAVLEAVLEARQTFTMFELGAGYGRWLVVAVCAARKKKLDLGFKLVAVEGEPSHFGWLHRHFLDNGLNPQDHQLIEAVVNATGEPTHFIVGHPNEWYGQAIVPHGFVMRDYPKGYTIVVPAVRLVDLLAPHSYVDLIDADIQGAELEVIQASIDMMSKKVRRAFISTHSAEIHSKLAETFDSAGWVRVEIHGWTGGAEETEFGPVTFGDGIQHWLNPRIVRG